MERVAFLIEESGERLSCMLNPESLVVRRNAGIRPQQSVNGSLTGLSLSDDPLLYTGGGRTELQLDLLFDVHLAGTTIQTRDVRDLTAPLWRLAENAPSRRAAAGNATVAGNATIAAAPATAGSGGYSQPPLVRFVWGKSWNILGVIASVAERFENFTAAGEPQRSWLRLRFIRVTESDQAAGFRSAIDAARGGQSPQAAAAAAATEALLGDLADQDPTLVAGGSDVTAVHTITGEGPAGDNLPYLAYLYFADPAKWRWLAWFNEIVDPLRLAAGTLINVPAAILFHRSDNP
ncbi:MAG: peptidoglycan-binding protein [Candidatus Promineifilaceae bacterium]